MIIRLEIDESTLDMIGLGMAVLGHSLVNGEFDDKMEGEQREELLMSVMAFVDKIQIIDDEIRRSKAGLN